MISENDDKKVTIELYGADISVPYDNPLDRTLLYDYHAYVYKKCQGRKDLLAVYKKNNTGLYAIGTTSVSNELTIVINRQLTRNIKPSELSVEVKVKAVATSDFIDSKAVSSAYAYMFPIEKSASPHSMS